MKKITLTIIVVFLAAVSGFTQTRTGEISRGIFHQEGIASWYGGEFNGRYTASGEIFYDTQFTAAHPLLPFGTILKVTNQHNNRSVTVRVNDRGPFVAARIIDLSRAAALELDMLKTGTAPVVVESLHEVSLPSRPSSGSSAVSASSAPGNSAIFNEPVSSQTAVIPSQSIVPESSNAARFKPAIPATATGKFYQVQVGAYKEPQHAINAYETLKKAGFNPSYERYGDYYRVVLAGLKQENLIEVSERLGIAGFKEVILREENR